MQQLLQTTALSQVVVAGVVAGVVLLEVKVVVVLVLA
jgi:hypothetical protein